MHPFAVRVVAVLLAAAALVAVRGPAAEASAGAFLYELEEDVAALHNQARIDAGLAPLPIEAGGRDNTRDYTWEVELHYTEQGGRRLSDNPHAPTHVQAQSFACGDGGGWFFENVGAHGPARESAALATGIHQTYMDSPAHRDNILDPRARFMSVGVRESSDGIVYSVVRFATCGAGGGGLGSADPHAGVLVREGLAASEATFADGGAAYAIIATTNTFADALGAAGLAGVHSPVLFTRGASPQDQDQPLSSGIRDELNRILAPGESVYILGGPNAVSMRAEDQLRADGWAVSRLYGATRYDTAARIADEIIARFGERNRRGVIVNGTAWVDALSVGNWAAVTNTPILLTGHDELPTVTDRWLTRHADRVAVIGGQSVVSDRVVRAVNATRIAGADRAATAVEVAERLWSRTAGRHMDKYLLVDGYASDTWGRALAWSAWSARQQAPLLIGGADGLPDAVSEYVASLGYDEAANRRAFIRCVPFRTAACNELDVLTRGGS